MSGNIVTKLIRLAFASAAGIAVFTAPVTWAQEGTNTIDLSNLVFFKGKAYAVTYEDGVSTEAMSTDVVRKIGYGRTSFVNISTTSSGTYSSDGMTSPHILYPGVHVEQVPIAAAGAAAGGTEAPRSLAYWSDARGWVATPFVEAGSFVIVTRTPSGTIVNGTSGSCVLTQGIATC